MNTVRFILACTLLTFFWVVESVQLQSHLPSPSTNVVSAETVGSAPCRDCPNPPLQQAVEIEEFRVIGQARRGHVFEVLVRYRTLINGIGAVSIRIPQHARFPDRTPGERSRREERTFTANQTRVERFNVQASENGWGLCNVQIDVSDAPTGYNPHAERWIKIQSTEDGFEVFDPLAPGDRQPTEISEVATGGDSPAQDYTVSVTGRITFLFNPVPETRFGLLGSTVVLWFRNTSNPGNWYHPVYSPNPIQGTHWDLLDEQGNFAFNFSFTGDLSAYNELIVLLSTVHDAAITPVPQDGYIVWHDNGFTTYFNEAEGIRASINGSQSNITVNQDGEVNPQAGRLLRYSMLSKRYVQALYGGNVPFTIPAIQMAINGDVAPNCGDFSSSNQRIRIHPDCVEFTTISHEYGHYLHYRMWVGTNKWSFAGSPIKEGWAIFYSFGARNYANRQYGDDIRDWDDNGEVASFNTVPYRYSGIRYAQPNQNHPDYAATACFLWNLYDDAHDPTFLAQAYSNADNDDITSHRRWVFEAMRQLPLGGTPESYSTFFKEGMAAATDEQTSVDRAYSFMFDNLYDLPPTRMRSAQARNFSAIVLSENQLRFDWNTGSYAGNPNHANPEIGYHLSERNGSNWTLINTIPFGQNSYTHTSASMFRDYRLSAYNASGTSVRPIEVTVAPAAPVISGFTQVPVPIYRYQSGTVTCNLSQGTGNITYAWTASDVPSNVSVYFSGNVAYIDNGIAKPSGTGWLAKEIKDGGTNDPMRPPFSLTCTASNSSGSSTSTFYPFLEYYAPPPGGCPFVYAWKDSGYVVDNNILPQSQLPENEGRDVTDYYQMFVPPSLEDGRYYLAVGEFENERSWLDQAKLLVIDHDPSVLVTVDDSGRVIQFTKPAAFIDAQLDSTEVLKYLQELDGVKVEAAKDETMTLTFARDGGTYEEGLLLVGQAEDKQAVAGRIAGSKEAGAGFTNFRLRRNMSYTWVLVPTADTSTVQIEIEWKQDAAVDYSELSKKLELTFTLHEAPLLAAIHSSSGEVTENLRTLDENYAELMPGEWITLQFDAPPDGEGMRRSFVLVSRGRYVALERSGSLAETPQQTHGTLQKSTAESPGLPSEFRLAQSYPNPFNPSTTIAYDLSEEAMVRLSVFNTLGQEVTRLVDGVETAGYKFVMFDASALPSGVYFYRMNATGTQTGATYTKVMKMLMIK
jgi:hypothetical protein